MTIRAKAFYGIVLVLGFCIAYKALGVSQGDGARSLLKRTVKPAASAIADLPPLPPGGVEKAAVVPPKPMTNTFIISWTNPKATATASVFMATSPRGPWSLVARTNVPPVRVRTTNAFALFRASWT